MAPFAHTLSRLRHIYYGSGGCLATPDEQSCRQRRLGRTRGTDSCSDVSSRREIRTRGDLLKSGYQTPVHSEPDICSIMDLSGQTIPSIHQNGALGSFDGLWVLHRLPRNLGKCISPHNLTFLRCSETILLTVATIPNPIPEDVANVHGSQDPAIPAIRSRVMIGEVYGAVTVRQRNTSEVPENEHEPPLLVVHIPIPWSVGCDGR